MAWPCPTDQPEAITPDAASPHYSPFISHDEGLSNLSFLNLRIGSLNVRGFKFNLPFLKSFLDSVDICCIQELWLQDYELDLLNSAHEEFHAWGITPPMHVDREFLVPRNRRGHGGVAILWRKLWRPQTLWICLKSPYWNQCVQPS